MKSFRENPDGEENQQASKQADREAFALKMQGRGDGEIFDGGESIVCEVVSSRSYTFTKRFWFLVAVFVLTLITCSLFLIASALSL